MPDVVTNNKINPLAQRLKALGLNGDQLSTKYGFSSSAFGQSSHREGPAQKTALFLLAAEEQGPEVHKGRCLSIADVEPDGTVGYLRRLFGADHLERRAKLWPADLTRENLRKWLVAWGMADVEGAEDVVAGFSKSFLAELSAEERRTSVEGVRLLCARRLGAPVVW